MLGIPALGTSPEGVNPIGGGDGSTDANGVYRDFMRRQGVVRVLTQMLRQELGETSARPEQILEVLGALQILLSKQPNPTQASRSWVLRYQKQAEGDRALEVQRVLASFRRVPTAAPRIRCSAALDSQRLWRAASH